jgi:protein-L-isoaspartate(D-aspartate) O-methyltransferase
VTEPPRPSPDRSGDEAERLARALRAAIADERVLGAIASVPRELFVPPRRRAEAYENTPLEIGCGQTISQPLVVARMCELLSPEPDDLALDVGTGSGYHAAVLAHLCRHVFSVERHAELSLLAAENLRTAGIENVSLVVGDGARGHPAGAPYDVINVAAAAWRSVPPALEDQLAMGGRLVLPVARRGQRLFLVRRTPDGLRRHRLEPVRFVPLVDEGEPPV